jgi:cyclic pyranopterin phosphate synthase
LQRVNISLDTLRSERFQAITRWGSLDTVLEGIEAAFAAGLEPVKINAVVIRGQNDDEVVDLARKATESGWHLRFIEWMPVGKASNAPDWRERVVTAAEMREQIERELGPLEPTTAVRGAGPARTFRLPGSAGTVGFISAVSEHFCGTCNRLRLTADGKLRPCLLAEHEIDLRGPLRAGIDDEALAALVREGIEAKPQGHRLADLIGTRDRAMTQIGG